MNSNSAIAVKSWLPKLQAHRGLWVHGAQQNTLAAIKLAHEAGYEMAEFDVQITSDDRVILFHDADIQGKQIKKLSYKEIGAHIEVTSLEELFRWFVNVEKFKLNIEIKSQSILNFQLEKKVSELIIKYQLQRRVMISSFNWFSLFKIRIFISSVYRALLLSFDKKSEVHFIRSFDIANLMCRPQMINLRYQDFSENFIKLADKIPIVLWTVNNLEIYRKFKNDIHGIISDSITPNDLKAVVDAEIH